MWLQCWSSAPRSDHVLEQWSPPLQAHGMMSPQFQSIQPQPPLQPVATSCVYVGAACTEQSVAQAYGSPQKSNVDRQIKHLLMETAGDTYDDHQQQIEEMLVRAMPDHYDD